MIEVIFKYKKEKIEMQFEAKTKITEACETFLTSINTDLESKTIIFNHAESIPVDSNLTFEEEMNSLGIDGNKCKIIIFDDATKKEGINVVVNKGGGEKKIVRAKKGEKMSSIFTKLKVNIKNMLFLKSGNLVEDFNQRVSDLANRQDKEDKMVQLVAIDNADNNDNDDQIQNNTGANASNQINEKKDPDKKIDTTNEKIDIPIEKNNITNEKIYIPNEKIAEDNLKDNLIDEEQNEEKKENEDKPAENRVIYIVPDETIRKYIRNSLLFIILEYCFIILFVWLGCTFNINDKFNSSLGTMLGTFIPVTLVGSIMSPIINHVIDESEFSYIGQSIYFIFYFAFISFYCFLLSYFTDYKFIIWILIAFAINYALLFIYTLFLNFRFKVVFPALLLLNALIAIITYFFILDMTITNIINASAVLLSFVIYNIISIFCAVFFFKLDNVTELEVKNWKSIYLAMIISYGIFFPLPLLFALICVAVIYIKDSCSSDCCDCYYCCDCCDCCFYGCCCC